ncbi:MAG: 4-hydroxythreonine-4-phosphate dehydrogenase PdxA [Planctomycetota bacterium]|nr:MAG: 4-hydroxythreonine-4-phosphate dehydrogenase PdxA [Planctomycetota bacterium]
MSDASEKPLLAITLGDPTGVGPEVVVKAWSDERVHACCRPVALGHPEILRRAVELTGSPARVEIVDSVSAITQLGLDPSDPSQIPCLPVGGDDVLEAPPATLDSRAGQAAYEAVVLATRRAMAGQFAGLVTAPLSKAALRAAGHHYPGHTELLAELCGVDDFAMMLYLPKTELPDSHAGLGVVHATLHCAIRAVPAQLTPGAIAAKCRLANAVMRDGFGVAEPRIGVCALNPHSGEEGLFGHEEQTIISPGVGMARAEGIAAVGPLPADTLMVRARDGEFDAVVAMYHDQGHIALKLLGMHRAVNITLGLPIVRTSVAHGTAFDRAWQGSAESSGMVAAIVAAAELAGRGFRFLT